MNVPGVGLIVGPTEGILVGPLLGDIVGSPTGGIVGAGEGEEDGVPAAGQYSGFMAKEKDGAKSNQPKASFIPIDCVPVHSLLK